MGEEEVVAIIRRRPDAILDALGSRPELLAGLMLKLAPWDRFATKEDVRMILEAVDKRFEDMNKRFEAMDKRFEDLMAYSDRRFEAIDKRFEDLRYYVDYRIALVERLLVGFNIPIL
ncbi:MAG: hypothetical protein QXU06_04045, partial [Candidatus Bathyarchaeia archaeon]